MNREIKSLPLLDNCNRIWEVPQGRELPLCLYRSILGAKLEDYVVIVCTETDTHLSLDSRLL